MRFFAYRANRSYAFLRILDLDTPRLSPISSAPALVTLNTDVSTESDAPRDCRSGKHEQGERWAPKGLVPRRIYTAAEKRLRPLIGGGVDQPLACHELNIGSDGEVAQATQPDVQQLQALQSGGVS